MSIHLRPTAPIAADALLPGDPGRALSLAQELFAQPKMSNHHRGLWGYYGETAEGRPLTIQATGIGGPSAAIVLTELAELGLERAIRVGTCVAISPDLEIGSLAVPTEAIAGDGTSRALGAGERTVPAPELLAALRAAAPAALAAPVASTDLFYGAPERSTEALDGAVALEMEAAALFALGPALGIDVACVLTVVEAGGERLADERLAEAELEMGRAAATAMGLTPLSPGDGGV